MLLHEFLCWIGIHNWNFTGSEFALDIAGEEGTHGDFNHYECKSCHKVKTTFEPV
jgi:hypothetical protein